MGWVTEVFGSSSALTPSQETARALLILVYGLILLRVSGRRTFAGWSPLDIVVSMEEGLKAISSTGSPAVLQGSSAERLTGGSRPLAGR